MYVCMFVRVCGRTYICMYVRTYVCIYVCMCVYVCTRVYVCMHVILLLLLLLSSPSSSLAIAFYVKEVEKLSLLFLFILPYLCPLKVQAYCPGHTPLLSKLSVYDRVVVYFCLVFRQRGEGVVVLLLPTGPLKSFSRLEPIPRCEPSTSPLAKA